MRVALFVSICAALTAVIASVLSVFAWSRSSALVAKLRSTILLQGEMHEIRDYVAKIDAWAKRINAREVMHERREGASSNGSTPRASSRPVSSTGMTKAELRQLAGIVPGQPAPHRE